VNTAPHEIAITRHQIGTESAQTCAAAAASVRRGRRTRSLPQGVGYAHGRPRDTGERDASE